MDLTALNPEQKRAAETLEGPVLILAGAGSGKTRALTYRVANLIDHGIPAWSILALTFTNKAAREMKTRVENLIGHEKAEEAIRSGLRTEQDRIYTVWYKNDRGQSTIRNISATQLRLVENQRLMAKGQLGVIKDRAELNAYLNATRNSMARDNSGTYRTVMNDTYRW